MKIIKKFMEQKKWKKNNNKIYLIKENGKKILFPNIKGMKFFIDGKNNTIEIYEPIKDIRPSEIRIIGNNAVFVLQKNSVLHNTHFSIYENAVVNIGDSFTCYGCSFSIAGGTKLNIGNDCLLSNNIYIRTDDGHTIIDNTTGIAYNKPADISIGNNVWICTKVSILKGVKINDNSVIALGSVVTKSFNESNIIIAGNPAKIIKRNIVWHKYGYNGYIYYLNKKETV